MSNWITVVVLSCLLALHNAQRLAPVPLFEEWRLRLAVDYVGVGNLFSAYLIAYSLSQIPVGMLADRFDSRRMAIAGAVLSVISSTMFALSDSYPMALLSRAGLGMAGALLYVPSVRYIVTAFGRERRGSVMGFVEVGAGLGQMMSLILLPYLAEQLDLSRAYLLLPIFGLLVLVGILVAMHPTPTSKTEHTKGNLRVLMGTGRFRAFLAYQFLGMLVVYGVAGWLPTFMRLEFGFSAVEAGMTSALWNLGLCIFSPIAGHISDRMKSRIPVLAGGAVVYIICSALFLTVRDPAVLLVTAFVAGAGSAFTSPVLMMTVGEAFAWAGPGLAVSMLGTTGQMASALTGPMYGYVLESTHTFVAVWGVALVLALFRIPLLLAARGKPAAVAGTQAATP